jgi:hypothetical protein
LHPARTARYLPRSTGDSARALGSIVAAAAITVAPPASALSLGVRSSNLFGRASLRDIPCESHGIHTDLYQSSGRLPRSGFPNHLQNDSRWQTEGRLPWGEPLWCGRTIRATTYR